MDQDRLEVYQLALKLFDLVDEIVEQLPRGRSDLGNQLTRAGLSVVNNIAEGAGKFSAADKRRFYSIASGSTTECAAMIDVCLRRKLILEPSHREAKELADRVVAMLVRLMKSLERRVGDRIGE